MRTLKTLTLTSMALVTMGLSNQAMADTAHTLQEVTLYDLQTNMAFKNQLKPEQIQNLRDYFSYERREPCQDYKSPPEGFVRIDCDLYYMQAKEMPKKRVVQAPVSQVLADYELYFGFDSADVDSNSKQTVNSIAREIMDHNPREVVVIGHADTAGPKAYNETLSQKRAMAVSAALTEMGVANRVIDTEAKGEMDLAVPTADGVPLERNRRVEVRFMK